jgi:hypothetical protein
MGSTESHVARYVIDILIHRVLVTVGPHVSDGLVSHHVARINEATNELCGWRTTLREWAVTVTFKAQCARMRQVVVAVAVGARRGTLSALANSAWSRCATRTRHEAGVVADEYGSLNEGRWRYTGTDSPFI